MSQTIVVGTAASISNESELNTWLIQSTNFGYSFVSIPIYKQGTIHRQFGELATLKELLAWRESLVLPSDTELTLDLAVSWATYLGVNSVLLRIPLDYEKDALLAFLQSYAHPSIILELQGTQLDDWINIQESLPTAQFNATKVSLSLLPNMTYDVRLNCQQLSLISIPTESFLINRTGYPVLPKSLQSILINLQNSAMANTKALIPILITGADICLKGYDSYRRYLEHLVQSQLVTQSFSEALCNTYNNVIQTPLQPLKDNLDSDTYAIFEQDPVKYEKYQEAISYAMQDLTKELGDTKTLSLMIVGAGRGPLVDRSLQSLHRLNIFNYKIYALEKNYTAILTLLRKNEHDWNNSVTIIYANIRSPSCEIPQVDLIISELLGSFGDNELSPECLDYAQKYLKPNGIMIPQWSKSYLTPVYAPRLHRAIVQESAADQQEAPTVIRSTWSLQIDEEQGVFEFHHPSNINACADNHDNNAHNRRTAQLRYANKTGNCIYCHGFEGYFEAGLYKDTMISIVPRRITKNMFSWFPMYFSLPAPVRVGPGENIDLWIHRCCDKSSVWYSWSVDNQTWSNVDGKASKYLM